MLNPRNQSLEVQAREKEGHFPEGQNGNRIEKKDEKRNAALKGKMVLVRISEPHVIWEKVPKCAVRAGALALIIATEEFLFVANAADKYCVAEIPVVVIKAKDADALLAPGTIQLYANKQHQNRLFGKLLSQGTWMQ